MRRILSPPFHPRRFYQFLHQAWPEGRLLRSKGYFWLASQPGVAWQWHQAGGIARYNPAGYFWQALAKEQWPDDAQSLGQIEPPARGDFARQRRQGIDTERIAASYNNGVLSVRIGKRPEIQPRRIEVKAS